MRSTGRRVARLAALWLLGAASGAALSGPVLVYREGAFCPHDRMPPAPRLTQQQAIERAQTLLPRDFCAPSLFVSGCDFEPEFTYDSWRIFARQYKLAGHEKRYGGLDHSYVVLDPLGNCLANIPGTWP